MTSTDRPLGEHHYTDEEMHNEDVAYEHSDVTIQTIVAYGVALLTLVAISAALVYGLFVVFEKQAEARDPQPSPVAAPANQTPQGPQLLTNEPRNLRQFRQEETSKLDGAGWMDQKAGIAHVPIDLAKKLVIQHGLPARQGTPEDVTEGTYAPAYGESSGGRAIPVKHGPAAGSTQSQPPALQPPQEIKK